MALFSLNKKIIGKDKTEIEFTNKDGKTVKRQAWAQHRNFFTNYTEVVQVDGKVKFVEPSRDRAIELIAKLGYATAFVLIDDKLPKQRTLGTNTKEASIFMVDFDNTSSLEEMMQHEMWSKVWFAYSTPSYGAIQQPLSDNDKKKLPAAQVAAIEPHVGMPKRNFRLVFRFEEPINATQIPLVGRGFLTTFPMADISCKDLARMMFGSVNGRVEKPEQEYKLTKQDVSKLMELGSSYKEDTKKTHHHTVKGEHTVAQINTANDSTYITLADDAQWTVTQLLQNPPGWKMPCYSPFRIESNPSAFVSVQPDGSLFCFDSGSSEKHFWATTKEQKLELTKKVKILAETQEPDYNEPIEITEPDVRVFTNPKGWDERTLIIRNFLKNKSKSLLLRTSEGFGKSTTIVEELIKNQKKIMFCCASNTQVAEKLESFKHHNPQRVISTGALFEETCGFKLITKEKQCLWDISPVDDDKTIDLMVKESKLTHSEAAEALNLIKEEAKSSRLLHSSLIITTFEMGSVLYTAALGHTGYTVVLDDPNASTFFTEDWGFNEQTQLPELKETRTKEEVIFGKKFEMQDQIIWTTTEKLTAEIIKLHHPETFTLDVEENLDNDNLILLIPTKLVRSHLKQVIPEMHKCIISETKDIVHFISDGVQAEHNLLSSKGKNTLKGNSVVVVSYPHPHEVLNTMAALEDTMLQFEVRNQIVVDKLNQALGREHGNRSTGSHSVVLCDPAFTSVIKNKVRYKVNEIKLMTRKVKLNGVPIEWRANTPQWWTLWLAYTQCWDTYIKIIGKKIFNTLTLHHLELTEPEFKLMKKYLEQPIKPVHWMWQKCFEVVDVEENDGRRNYSVELACLIKEEMVKKTHVLKSMAKKGKKKYCKEQHTKMFFPGEEPEGWYQVK